MLTMLDLRIDHHPMLHTTVAHTNFDLGSVSTPVSLALPVVSWLLINGRRKMEKEKKTKEIYYSSKLDV